MSTSPNNTPPTISELYSAAIGSSNLKLGERRGDVDYLIAAGSIPETIGANLFRLLDEYEKLRGPLDAARRWAQSQRDQALELRKEALREPRIRMNPGLGSVGMDLSEKREARLRADAALLETGALASVLAEHVLILDRLRSLPGVRLQIGSLALTLARRKRIDKSDRDILHVAGRVLDALLAPLCHHCNGRGFNGGAARAERITQCRPCGGFGLRRRDIGRDEAERLFATELGAELEALMTKVGPEIRAALKTVEAQKEWVAEQTGSAI